MDAKEYLYQENVIKLYYCPGSSYCDAGWYWEVFKDGEKLADNSKSCPDFPLESALIYAKRYVDDSLGIESDEIPILVFEGVKNAE
jgi:hypothetical protein